MKNSLPTSLVFICPISIEAAASDEKAVPKFSMVAYTGGPMRIEGFDHPVVVDLEGISIDRQNIPIRLDHNPKQGVGHTDRVVIEHGQILAEGLVSRDTSWARDVTKSGQRGFPWQASIGASILDAQFIPNGQTVHVNGRTFEGPLYIVRKSILKEISFVDSAADDKTSARIAAQSGDAPSMENEVQEQADKTAETVNTQEKHVCTCQTKTPETLQAAAADPVVDMRQRIAAETKRIQDIRTVCNGKYADIEAKAIEEGWEVTKCELEVLRASRPKAPAGHIRTANHTGAVLEASALMTSGEFSSASLEKHFDEKTLEAASKLRGVGIQELADLACGQHLPKFRSDPAAWLQAAFSTTSLPGILSNVAHKMLLEGFNLTDQTWRSICKLASVGDFKEHTRYRLTNDFKFEKVGPDGELKHGKLGEEQFGNKADTHGIMFALTRQMIINDDLGAFAEIPRLIGMGAGDAINDAVWPLLLSLVGTGFFSTANKNYKAGADTALSIDSLSTARQLFRKQSKPGKNSKRPLGIMPHILLVPTALEDLAVQLMTSKELLMTTAEGVPAPRTNPQVGRYQVVSTEYIGGEFLDNGSDKAWYLFADPRILAAVEVAFLNGKDSPTVERADADFNTLGVQFRGYIDFGTRQQDNRAAVLMKGQA